MRFSHKWFCDRPTQAYICFVSTIMKYFYFRYIIKCGWNFILNVSSFANSEIITLECYLVVFGSVFELILSHYISYYISYIIISCLLCRKCYEDVCIVTVYVDCMTAIHDCMLRVCVSHCVVSFIYVEYMSIMCIQ